MSADVTETQVRVLHPDRHSLHIPQRLCLSLKAAELRAILQRILHRNVT
jgi:hypothetical protein